METALLLATPKLVLIALVLFIIGTLVWLYYLMLAIYDLKRSRWK